ncbi:MAG TPA: hypothetical protein VK956_03815, partial [Verrucomicrobium sp.]|nr:hypothetical protein [Verrucomicrobium sp.]
SVEVAKASDAVMELRSWQRENRCPSNDPDPEKPPIPTITAEKSQSVTLKQQTPTAIQTQ